MSAPTQPTPGHQQRFLRVDGMDCASCVASVERVARKVAGVQDIRVNLARGRAVVEFDPGQTTDAAVAAAITAVGYPSEPEPETAAAGGEAQRVARQATEAREWLWRAGVGAALWIPA